MKTIKFLLIAILFIGAYSASAQWTTSGTNAYNTNTGNVGISNGSAFTPTRLLHVAKNMVGPQITIQNLGGSGGAAFEMIDDLGANTWRFKSFASGGKSGFKIRDHISGLDVITVEKAAMANAIYIEAGGFVGIGGISNPQSALAVNGKITCKEVEVTLTGWADYVFNDDYQLTPLSEVEKFIKENKHLEGIPSEKEIVENGLSVGEMNKQLMKKVEELTLYVIQLQKQVNELKINK
jgi:hypothetical protein